MEVISGVERRRRWRAEEKARIVAEAEEPGACFAQVARRYDVSRGLLWHWRRQVRGGKMALPPAVTAEFVPIQVLADATSKPAIAVTTGRAGADIVEIILPDGLCLRVNIGVEAAALRRLLGVLRG